MGKRFRGGGAFKPKGSRTLVKCQSAGKRSRRSELEDDRAGKKSRHTELKDAPHASRSSLDMMYEKKRTPASEEDDDEEFGEEDDYEEEEKGEEEEEGMEVQREPSLYDDLLKKLKSSTKSRVVKNEKRKSKNKNVSDFEEGDYEFASDEEDLSEGPDDDTATRSVLGDVARLSEDDDSDMAMDDDDVSDAENRSIEDNSNDLGSSSLSQRKFGTHIAHKLSEEDIEKLLKKEWKYKWRMPALDSSNCRWAGTGDSLQKDTNVAATAPYGLKEKLYKHWLELYKTSGENDFQSSKQRSFFSLCNSYRDILHHRKKAFYKKGSDEDSCIMDAYIMHSLNHVFKTRDLITKNDAKLAKNQEKAREEVLMSDSFLDQGFTRPKVLILLPFASIAHRLVRRLIQLTPSANKTLDSKVTGAKINELSMPLIFGFRRATVMVNVEYMDRFIKEFGVKSEEDMDDLAALDLKLQKPSKPSDHQALFCGNNKDCFMLGIKFTRKSTRLYNDFYTSDMIVASPLGLKVKIDEAVLNKEKNVDYLSSIEILVVDHADVISMQRWEYVSEVVKHLNLLPSKELGGDITRIRPWYIDGHAQFYRQTVILSSYLNPDISAFFRSCLNFEGKLRFSCEYKGVLPNVVSQVRQVYERFDSDSIANAADDARRLEYFIEKVFPKIKDSVQGGIMLFISSYFEYVRIRNFLKSQNASFCLLGEYTDPSDISRARNWFIQGTRKIMLYTERAHFYHRYKIRGIQNLIIYSLPERKDFYPEVLNMLEGSQNMTCTVLFSQFDQLRLERIVGTAAAKRMTKSEKSLFIFK